MATNVPFDIDAAADLTDLSIQKIFPKSGTNLQEYHKDYYNVETVTDYITKDSSITSIDPFSKIPENGQIPAGSPHQGFDKTYTQGFFSGMLRVTRPMWRYGLKTRKLEGLSVELKKNAIRFTEKVLANVLNNATSTSYTETEGRLSYTVTNTGGDGLAFQSASHTREDGGSNWSNLITDGTTNNMDFDYDAWKAARKTAAAVLGGIGEELDIELDTIIVKKESSAHHRAQEVLKAIQDGKMPGSSNRDGAAGGTFKILAVPYLTSDTAWGAFDSKLMSDVMGLQVKMGMPLTLDPQFIDYDTKEIKYSAGKDFAYGFNDVRMFFWSTGLNA